MPRQARFPTGYIEDDKHEYPSHYQLVSAAPPTLPTANHVPFRKGFIWQSNVGMCVGAWLKRGIQLWREMNGQSDLRQISGKCAYDIGRVMMFRGVPPEQVPPLRDVGSMPRLVLEGAQLLGLCDEEDYPDPTSPAWNPAFINRKPTPDDLVNAYDMRGLQFFEISSGAWGLRNSIRACMVRRQPVGISLFVDTKVMENRGELVTAIDLNDPEGGRHMVGVLDASRDDEAILDNWWDHPGMVGGEWGMPVQNKFGLPRGVWRVAWPLLERRIIQALAVQGVPLKRVAAVG